MSTNRVLPSEDLHMLWENLIYEKDIKEKVNLKTLLRSQCGQSATQNDPNIVLLINALKFPF